MKPLITVVIPIYNAERYLGECLNSICKQTYFNLDIVLINDGSTDNSLAICNNFQARDQRIRVFDRSNHGVGATRNFGIKQAMGKFVCFVDSDDYVQPTLIEELYSEFERNSQIKMSLCGISRFNNGVMENNVSKIMIYPESILTVKEYLLNILLKEQTSIFCGGPYAKLFIHKYLIDNSINFPEDTSFAEDFIFNMKFLGCLHENDLIGVLDKPLYMYRENVSTSLSNIYPQRVNSVQYARQRFNTFNTFCNLYKHFDLYRNNSKEINVLLRRFLSAIIIHTCKSDSKYKEKRKILQNVRECNCVNQCLSYKYRCPYKDKIRILFFKAKWYFVLYGFEKSIIVVKNLVKHK